MIKDQERQKRLSALEALGAQSAIEALQSKHKNSDIRQFVESLEEDAKILGGKKWNA